MKKKLEDLLKEQEDALQEDITSLEEDDTDLVEEVDITDEDKVIEEADYPSVDFKKSEAKGGKGGKAEYPTVDFKKSEAKGGPQKPGLMPTVDFKGEDDTVNKKTPIDPENYNKEKPNFDPEVVKQLTKEDISDETKEHLSSLFSGEEITEEFRNKVQEVFEAAVIVTAQKALNEKVDEIVQEYNDKFEIALTVCEEEVEVYKEQLNEQTEKYLDYVIEQWTEENKPTIQSNIRTELTESFINGLKDLFVEHYIDIPEDKVDLVEQMIEDHEALKAEHESVLNENLNLRKENKTAIKSFIIREHSKDLSDSEKEKFNALVEHISFDEEENFKAKLNEITEAYFGDELVVESSLEDDTPLEIVEEEVKKPVVEQLNEVQQMAAVMTKFLKKQ